MNFPLGRFLHFLQRVFESGAIIGKLLHRQEKLAVELRLLTRKDIDIGLLEIAEQLLLQPTFPARETALRDIEVIVRQALQTMNLSERGLDRLPQQARRRGVLPAIAAAKIKGNEFPPRLL